MQIVQGAFPTTQVWRTLVLFSADNADSYLYRFGEALSKAQNGIVIAAVIVPDQTPELLERARATAFELESYGEGAAKCDVLIVKIDETRNDLRNLVTRGKIDLLLFDTENTAQNNLNDLPCTIAVMRGSYSNPEIRQKPIQRIVIPTAGGPATINILRMLVQLPRTFELDILYVARADQGHHEVALGNQQLKRIVQSLDAEDRINTKVVEATSPTQGILEAVANDYDLVIMGASNEGSLDRFLFGNIVDAVVRESKTPVIIARESTRPVLGGALHWLDYGLQRIIPHLSVSERAQVYMRVRRNSRPNLDYFVLMTLSAAIASLGLLQDSPAVVIGAMLVAPLMSPIVGSGMAIVLGDLRFLRYALGSALRGMFIALLVGFLIGLVAGNNNLTPEILARTEPTLIDLMIALFSGLAGAFAIAYTGAASALPGVAIAAALVPPLASSGLAYSQGRFGDGTGALLLFITNFIAISSAATLVFLAFGFRPKTSQKARRTIQQRTTRIALGLLLGIGIFLSYATYTLAKTNTINQNTYTIVQQTVEGVNTAFPAIEIEYDSLVIETDSDPSAPLLLDLTLRSTHELPIIAVQTLSDVIGQRLQDEIGLDREMILELTVINVTKPKPFEPPTPTPEPLALQ
ncbi:MAG: DUF389 domain-containing protein [Anaerolineae bacterium]|nr:DUF389 domain-containing protein [Anaerolineae bacterium]MCO5206312.1 DUF389 domain-containing protein [Anaerolineae bacterium]